MIADDEILIKNNFFDTETFEKIKKDVQNIMHQGKFSNRFDAFEDISSYNKIYFHHYLNDKHFAVQYIHKYYKEKYKVKITDMQSFYFLSTKNELPTPHYDHNHNCLIYLQGENLLNNGTGFYDDNQLTTHIGFKENRGIVFNGSKHMHASLQSFGLESGTRFAMANFIYKFENEA